MAWFKNRYICPECRSSWEDEWSCACDDECGECGSESISPVETFDLTLRLEKLHADTWTVSLSPDHAEESPEFREIGVIAISENGKPAFTGYLGQK